MSTYADLIVGDKINHGRLGGPLEVIRKEDQGEGWRLYDLHDGRGTTYAYSHHDSEPVQIVERAMRPGDRPEHSTNPAADLPIRINVYMTLTPQEYATGWGSDPTELEGSIIARLSEVYGDDGGAYMPHVLGIDVEED